MKVASVVRALAVYGVECKYNKWMARCLGANPERGNFSFFPDGDGISVRDGVLYFGPARESGCRQYRVLRDFLAAVVGRERDGVVGSELYRVTLTPGLRGWVGFELRNAATREHGCVQAFFAGKEAIAMALGYVEGDCPLEVVVDWCGERAER